MIIREQEDKAGGNLRTRCESVRIKRDDPSTSYQCQEALPLFMTGMKFSFGDFPPVQRKVQRETRAKSAKNVSLTEV